jgi:AraC family transcriptional regulator of adaptative response / DNA-3-methyladenine glycosylase II
MSENGRPPRRRCVIVPVMTHDHDILYRAVASRDPRFDGRFFTAVLTTGIYCRPVCPARTPRPGNVSFYPSAAAAAEAGFRPCRRCRPETAPGTPAWTGTGATVTRALRLIEQGALDAGSVEELAARLGLGDRHLRRLFLAHLGATPVAVAQTRRVHFAKTLLDDTDLPMIRVAAAAGFGSVRRFNDVMRCAFGRAPSELRALRGRRIAACAEGSVGLELAYRPPLDWPALLAYLGPRAIPGVEAVDGDVYRRTVRCGDVAGVIAVRPSTRGHALVLDVPAALSPHLLHCVERTRDLFDLRADPAAVASVLSADPLLAARVRARPGLRVPGAWDRFETVIRAVLGQQITVRGATTLAGRLAAAFGASLPGDPLCNRLFPDAATFAALDQDALCRCGLTGARARTVLAVARAVRDGELPLDGAADPDAWLAAACTLPGIGDWTAQYVALRALRHPDAFPAGDLGVRRALEAAGEPGSPAAARRRAEAWRPWRGYAVLHLWQGEDR